MTVALAPTSMLDGLGETGVVCAVVVAVSVADGFVVVPEAILCLVGRGAKNLVMVALLDGPLRFRLAASPPSRLAAFKGDMREVLSTAANDDGTP